MKKLVLLLFPLAMVACTTTQDASIGNLAKNEQEPAKEAKEKKKYICVKEKVTGSRMKSKKRCYDKEEYELQQEQDREAIRKLKDSGVRRPVIN